MKKFWMIGLVLSFALSACEQAATEKNEYSGLGEMVVDKNPQLPTTFVDTSGHRYAWTKMYNPVQSIKSRVQPPKGFERIPMPENSFGSWLRGLPLKPGHPDVMLYNGEPKGFQDAQYAVLDIDVGKRDLQQCADAVMRLRAEYLFSQNKDEAIHFNFTSGANCPWSKWQEGYRPSINGSKVSWSKKKGASRSYSNFKAYMNVIFTYAGTKSLEKELQKVGTLKELQIGDVFIQGGFPGHSILVMDIAKNAETGKRMYMLAQSYMPAQDIHLLLNPASADRSPWYDAEIDTEVITPEWVFLQQDLRRFKPEAE